MYIPIILGTAREGRRSENVAKFMLTEVKKFGFDTEIIDVRDFLIGHTDNTGKSNLAQKYSTLIKKAEALIIVSPEYNHGYPGELKIMLDMLYAEYAGKPVGICGVSIGQFGGARMVEQLRQVLIEFSMVPIREALYFGNVSSLFDAENNITEPDFTNRVQKFLENLKQHLR